MVCVGGQVHCIRLDDLHAHSLAPSKQEWTHKVSLDPINIAIDLHDRVLNRCCRVVEELLRVGLDINVRTARGTALHEAALCGKVLDR